MKTQILVFILSTFALLSGCSSMSKTECLAIDWKQIGLDDGNKGINTSNIDSYRESCSKYDLEPDTAAYLQGHEQGVALFCQPENAFALGEQGYQYSVACPQEFKNEYQIGNQFFFVHRNIDQVEQNLNSNAATISKLQAGISRDNIRLNSGNLSVFEENQLRQNIDSMTSQVRGYELESERLEPIINQLRQELRKLRIFYNR